MWECGSTNIIVIQEEFGRSLGPAFTTAQGQQLSTREINEGFLEVLQEIYDKTKSKFPPEITDQFEIDERYNVYRSLRHTSTTQATEAGVPKADIKVVNRWQREERASANQPNLPMHQHYTDYTMLKKPFLCYTRAI